MPRLHPGKEMEMAERRAEVARRICSGMPYRQIARDLGIGLATVHADKCAAIAEWRSQYACDVGAQAVIDLARIDRLIARLELEIEFTQDLPAVTRAYLAALTRRAAILGFDARDRRESGLQLQPPEAEIVGDSPALPDGRTVGKGDAARIYAAFAPQAPGPAICATPDHREIDTAIAQAQALRSRSP